MLGGRDIAIRGGELQATQRKEVEEQTRGRVRSPSLLTIANADLLAGGSPVEGIG
jgi:hypothetical protein